MRRSTLRSIFSVAEIVLGLVLVALGTYSLIMNLECPPDAVDCVGWGLLGAAMFLIPGILVVAAGTLSYIRKTLRLVAIQAVLIGILAAYYVWGFAFP